VTAEKMAYLKQYCEHVQKQNLISSEETTQSRVKHSH